MMRMKTRGDRSARRASTSPPRSSSSSTAAASRSVWWTETPLGASSRCSSHPTRSTHRRIPKNSRGKRTTPSNDQRWRGSRPRPAAPSSDTPRASTAKRGVPRGVPTSSQLCSPRWSPRRITSCTASTRRLSPRGIRPTHAAGARSSSSCPRRGRISAGRWTG